MSRLTRNFSQDRQFEVHSPRAHMVIETPGVRRSHRAQWLLSLTISLAAMGLGNPASAVVIGVNVFANYTAEDGSVGRVGPISQSASSGTVSQNANSAFLGSGGTGAAVAHFGALHSSTMAGAIRGNIFDGGASAGRAYAAANWSDSVTMTGTGLSGSGLANIWFFVDPSSDLFNRGTAGLGGSFSATAAANFVFRVNGAEALTFDRQAVLNHLGTDPTLTYTRVNGIDHTGGLGGMWKVSVPITFDEVFVMDTELVTTASTLAGSNSTVSSFANFGNSVYWAGITSITLADGSVATEFSALGSTGYDWKTSAVPVPEPSNAWLFFFGLGMLAMLPRARKTFIQKMLA